MSEYAPHETPVEPEVMTAQCPWCDEIKPLVPHDTKPGRLTAWCYCQGDRRDFLEINAPLQKRRKKESDQ